MKRIALDTDAVNRLADTPGLVDAAQRAHAQDALVFVVSHVVGDELADTRDATRRAHLLTVFDTLPKVIVPTRGAIWKFSRWGGATWGDGGDSGVTLDEVRPAGESRDETHEDALIATTASGEADVLVTSDDGLATKVRASRAACEVWSFGRLKRFIRAAVRSRKAPPDAMGDAWPPWEQRTGGTT